jgi:hypothetical protein
MPGMVAGMSRGWQRVVFVARVAMVCVSCGFWLLGLDEVSGDFVSLQANAERMRVELEIAFWSASDCSSKHISEASMLEYTLSYATLVYELIYENNRECSAAKVLRAPDDHQKESARTTIS